MYLEFGSELPPATQWLLGGRYLYLVAGVFLGTSSWFVLYGKHASAAVQMWAFGILGLEFALVIFAVAALFMPILQLAGASTT